MAMKKMLYISHVDWNWIKQRPHFLAEGLMELCDTTVLYMFQNRKRATLQKRTAQKKNVHPVFTIPMANRIKPLDWINNIFLAIQVFVHVKRVNPDCIYLTYPAQVVTIPKNYQGVIIYDCMDDHIAMCPKSGREIMHKKEASLVDLADYIFISSDNLRDVLLNRYGDACKEKIYLIRNGYDGSVLATKEKVLCGKKRFTISYIGTIGKWFNFDYILKSLQDIPNLSYRIIGPSHVKLPANERIEYLGTVEHYMLYDAVRDTDCLAMPFVLNDIVRSVDPVKLYEYINFNMNILCVRYPEVERFEPFVYFYEDYESYVGQIVKMMENNNIKYDNLQRLQFLKSNDWKSRVQSIMEILQKC